MALRYLSASQMLLSILRTHSELRTCFILTKQRSWGALKSEAVFLRDQSDTFSFVRIIIMPYVWYKDTLSVWASFKLENQSKLLDQAVVVQRAWRKQLPVDSWVWAVHPTPHRAPCRDHEHLFSRAAVACIAQQVSLLLSAPVSLTMHCLVHVKEEKTSAMQHFFHCTTPIHVLSSREENKLKKTG